MLMMYRGYTLVPVREKAQSQVKSLLPFKLHHGNEEFR